MANNRVINGIAVDDSADNGKVPVFNSTTKSFDMTTPSGGGGAWTELASVDLSGGAASSLSSGTITAKNKLRVFVYWGTVSSGIQYFRFNADSGSNYSGASILDGTYEGTYSTTGFRTNQTGGTTGGFIVIDINNTASIAKHITGTSTLSNDSLVQVGGKWNNTANQITEVIFHAGAGNLPTTTTMLVLGAD